MQFLLNRKHITLASKSKPFNPVKDITDFAVFWYLSALLLTIQFIRSAPHSVL
jgi:hypothetical protein